MLLPLPAILLVRVRGGNHLGVLDRSFYGMPATMSPGRIQTSILMRLF